MILGVVMLIYGLAFHHIGVLKGPAPEKPSDAPVWPGDILNLPESDVIKDATVGGVVRHSAGLLQRTYGEQKKPEQFCPT
jgi:hypothetical protein